MRDLLLERLERDLIGPDDDNEELASRPSDVYLTGVLWPQEARMGGEEDDRLGNSGGNEDNHAGGTAEEEETPVFGQARPCSAGVSFAVGLNEGSPVVTVRVRFATYEPVEVDGQSEGRFEKRWRRLFHDGTVRLALDRDAGFVALEELPEEAKLHVRTVPWTGGTLATITLVNVARPDEDKGREGIEGLTFFQVEMEIRPSEGTRLVARPSRRVVLDDDDRSAELLYRSTREFATGHTCSAKREVGPDPEFAIMVGITWVPRVKVPGTSPEGHALFDALRQDGKRQPLSARWLAHATQQELDEALTMMPETYERWIELQEAGLGDIPQEFREQAECNIQTCRRVLKRISDGVVRIVRDPEASRAFRLANMAMDLQYGWDPIKGAGGSLNWRPFQLGFILMAADSVVDREHPDRAVMDLLWFPTGGGKTEAYLALIAFLAFYRRLAASEGPDAGAGVVAVMRYTLRLLTTQQFTRACSVMLACEAIRRGSAGDIETGDLGSVPFSAGLWVGGEATPNGIRQAADALATRSQPTPEQLLNCPACQKKLQWSSTAMRDAIHVRCLHEACILFHPDEPLPVWTVDEDVYRERPTLLIGTIDKFAQIVRRAEVNELFGLDGRCPPDLVLQDELHLISGPLGTVAGLYEAAIDCMFANDGSRPKIIGSTATIRRAPEQVRALFDRKTEQFPPPCLNAGDSGFAVEDPDSPGRVYAAVTTAGRSAKFALQAVAASLLQSAEGGTDDDQTRDPYWTLVSYFNSLRELGGALALMRDDVNDSLSVLADRRREDAREPECIEELTSRRTQEEIRDMLVKLETSAGDDNAALDVALATNMLSVGVDIPRLGLMLVNGQPKGIAEYIQATSRVGRGRIPGLVVSLLNNAKARDRSRYETFSTWHQTLYRDVEPTSVTPFASRARDRALHAVLVALVRHLAPGTLSHPKFDDEALHAALSFIDYIVERARRIDPEENDVRTELERCLGAWKRRKPESYWHRNTRISLLQDAERAAMLRTIGRMPGEAWPTLNSMRDVEPSTRFKLAEWLRASQPEVNADG